MTLTDTHTHEYYETDPLKRAELMARCAANGIDRLFLPNVDFGSVSKVFALADAYPKNCFAMLGLHPCDVKANWQDELKAIKQAGEGHTFYAIGEIGIDLYWDKSNLTDQIAAFKTQIAWAKALKLPIVIHCREAFDEVFAVLEEARDENLHGIFHCFTGNAAQARQAIDLGFYLGIGGVVTYKNGGLDKIIPQIQLKHIVLETDSPYLTPVPHRGKPNESSYLIYIAQKVADLLQVSIDVVADITTKNSKDVFGV